jgi:hypothetical protein
MRFSVVRAVCKKLNRDVLRRCIQGNGRWTGMLVAGIFLITFFIGNYSAQAFTTNDVSLYMNSYSNAFYRLSGTNAWFKDIQNGATTSGNRTYFWGQA